MHRVSSRPSAAQLVRLAEVAQVDLRTVHRAIAQGVDVIRGKYVRDRLRAAATKLGIKL